MRSATISMVPECVLDATANDPYYDGAPEANESAWVSCPMESIAPTGEVATVVHAFPASDIAPHIAEVWINDEGFVRSLCTCGAYVDDSHYPNLTVYHERHHGAREAADTSR